MGAWSLYFLAKPLLYTMQLAQPLWLANLALALVLAFPIPGARLRAARHALAVVPALWLLAVELSPGGVFHPAALLELLLQFRPAYLLELAGRVHLARAAIGLALLVLAWLLLRRRIRFATLAFLGLLAGPLVPPPGAGNLPAAIDAARGAGAGAFIAANADPDRALEDFLDRERTRRVFPARAGAASFDIVLLSVCSLSVDDLEATHLQDAPVLASLDLVFRNFNSAATYSGPAVLRLVHATCGQAAQADLYSTAPPRECLLLPALADAGYRTSFVLNHDGRFGDFARQVRDFGGLPSEPLVDRGAPVVLTAFDGSAVRSDEAVLARWLQSRAAEPGPAALLYNTITLHDGNSGPGLPSDSLRSYQPRLERLLGDLARFEDLVRASGRPTLLVLVPEHGAGLRGDAQQLAGLRELPLRAITRVPAGVKLLNFPKFAPRAPGTGPVRVEAPSSYLALATLIAGLLQLGPEGADATALERLAGALPATAWVAENEGTIVLGRAGGDLLRTPQGRWSAVPAVATP